MLQKKVFKAYDVRGVYGSEWDAVGAAAVARAFVEKFQIKNCVLGWDMRASCIPMVAAIEAALVAGGTNVVKVGRVTTPMLYFATCHSGEYDGGVMVTASHNTGEWNGMKLLLGDGMPVGEASGLYDVRDRACAAHDGTVPFVDACDASGALLRGRVTDRDVRDAYFEKIFSLVHFDGASPQKISAVIDCGNGMEGAVIDEVVRRARAVGALADADILYAEPDGNFPNHEANPLKEETLIELKRRAVAAHTIGVAFDGDGDRVGFVDENGRVISGDIMTGIVARELLATRPGAIVLYDLRSRRATARAITASGGTPIMCRVGHAFIKKQMRELGALFAGELSSHFYFKDFFSVECADLMVLYVLHIMQASGRELSALADEFLVDAHSDELNFHVADRDATFAAIEKEFAPRARTCSTLDGLLFDMPDDGTGAWWFNVRPSNTEPIVRLNVEARDAGALKKHLEEIIRIIAPTS